LQTMAIMKCICTKDYRSNCNNIAEAKSRTEHIHVVSAGKP